MSFTMLSLRTLAIGIAASSLFSLSSCTEPQPQGAPVAAPGGNQPAPPPAKRKQTTDYPLATPHPTEKNRVISPFKPHNVIDVKGLRSGQLAWDPSTAPIDPSTGKLDLSQAKIFEIP